MELKKKEYRISSETLRKVIPALDKNRSVYSQDGEEDNDDAVCEAYASLLIEVEEQEEER